MPEAIAGTVRDELPWWAGLAVLKRSEKYDVPSIERRIPAPMRHRTAIEPRVLEQAKSVMVYRMWAALTRLERVAEPSLWNTDPPDAESSREFVFFDKVTPFGEEEYRKLSDLSSGRAFREGSWPAPEKPE